MRGVCVVWQVGNVRVRRCAGYGGRMCVTVFFGMLLCACLRVCGFACVHMCVCACVRVRMRACVRVRVWVCV